jgi:hypothetical protein
VRNSSGLQLFTCGWLPASASPKALVFLCHGYGMECSGFMKGMDGINLSLDPVDDEEQRLREVT